MEHNDYDQLDFKKLLSEYIQYNQDMREAPGGVASFDAWIDGIEDYSSIRSRRRSEGLKTIRVFAEKENLVAYVNGLNRGIIETEIKSIHTSFGKGLLFCKAVEEWLKKPHKETNQKKTIDFGTWHLFFFYGKKKHPKLALAQLKIVDHEIAELINVKEPRNLHYKGYYSSSSNVLSFDLQAKGSKVHLKAYYDPGVDYTVVAGGYITYEDSKISMGSFLLYKESLMNNENLISDSHVLELRNTQEGTLLYPEVFQYLRNKKRNYIRIPNRIFDRKSLEEVLDDHLHKWDQRFVSGSKISVLYGHPKDSIKIVPLTNKPLDPTKLRNTDIENVSKTIDSICSSNEFKDLVSLNEQTLSTKNPIENLIARTEQTDLYILFYPGSDTASYSILELGLCLKSVKMILFIYNEDSVSQKFSRFFSSMDNYIKVIAYKGCLEKRDLLKIEETLTSCIDTCLKNS